MIGDDAKKAPSEELGKANGEGEGNGHRDIYDGDHEGKGTRTIFPLASYNFVAWKTRKRLTRVQSLLSDVIDFEGFLPFAVLFGLDGWKEEYPESEESEEVR